VSRDIDDLRHPEWTGAPVGGERRYGPLVVFKSFPDFYARERCGNKANTVRVMPRREYVERLEFADTCMEVGEPATIHVLNAETGEGFYRRITDICCIGELPGVDVWCISWQHEDGDGAYEEDSDEV
jgi:hypothetical protein